MALTEHKTREEQELERLLDARFVAPHGADLADSICRAALHVPQKQAGGILIWFSRPSLSVALSKPVFAFAMVLTLGFLMGMTSPSGYLFGDNEDTFAAIGNADNTGDVL